MTDPTADGVRALLTTVRALHTSMQRAVLARCAASSCDELSSVAADASGDTIYAIDRVSEELLVASLQDDAERFGGLVLVAEGVHGGSLTLPRGLSEARARYRLIVDPIDGTRGLMYQKRSAWILTGIAPNRGPGTRLRDVLAAAQTEIPTLKQHLADELWAIRGEEARAERVHVQTGERTPLALRPSRATNVEHGYAMLSRFFPGGRDVLAAIDDELARAMLGPPEPGKARCFEEQYASTGGQLYELTVGHDRFNADLRPLLADVLAARGEQLGLCCHPYDIATALIAEEAGVLLTNPDGTPLDCPLDVEFDVAWVGYANAALRSKIEGVLQRALARHGLRRASDGRP